MSDFRLAMVLIAMAIAWGLLWYWIDGARQWTC